MIWIVSSMMSKSKTQSRLNGFGGFESKPVVRSGFSKEVLWGRVEAMSQRVCLIIIACTGVAWGVCVEQGDWN